MPSFTDADLDRVARTPDLHVAPFHDDGTTYGTFTQTPALVVDGRESVRAANGQASRWCRAAIEQGAGRVRVGEQVLPPGCSAASQPTST